MNRAGRIAAAPSPYGLRLRNDTSAQPHTVRRRERPTRCPPNREQLTEFADERFDDFVGVRFEADFSVRAAYLAPYYWVAERVKPVKDKHRLTIKAVLDEAESLEHLDLDQT
jgi:hypothetical protein